MFDTEFGIERNVDIVKGGVLREKVFKTVEDLEVLPKENPDKLCISVCGTYAIHCVIDDE